MCQNPKINQSFFLKTGYPYLPVSEFSFDLPENNGVKLYEQIKGGANLFEVIPGLKDVFLGGDNVKLKYGQFLRNREIWHNGTRYLSEPEAVKGLLPHYQVLSREKMRAGVTTSRLGKIEHSLFVDALDNFPNASRFQRVTQFNFEPVRGDDIVLVDRQLVR